MSFNPRGSTPSKAGAWRTPAAVSVVLLLASVGYMLGRSRTQTPTTPAEAERSVGPGPNGSTYPATPPLDVTPIAGTWGFASITGVAPALLPRGAVPDNRSDLVVEGDGSFRWGRWSGRVEGSGKDFALLVERPTELRQRFDEYGASIGIALRGGELLVSLPDLGQDRDVDRGEAQEDIDSPDMAFRRVGSGSGESP